MTAPLALRFLLAEPERRVLRSIAGRLPARVLPDHLTALGVVAAAGIAAAYVLSTGLGLPDLAGMAIVAAMAVSLLIRSARNLRALARLEPSQSAAS